MKAHYKTKNNRLTIELEAGNPKDLFAAVASVSEIFDADQYCGMCQTDRIFYRVRENAGNHFYEMVCSEGACGAVLEFGQHRQGGTLFPKRKNEQGQRLENRGWQRYQPQTS